MTPCKLTKLLAFRVYKNNAQLLICACIGEFLFLCEHFWVKHDINFYAMYLQKKNFTGNQGRLHFLAEQNAEIIFSYNNFWIVQHSD